MKVCTKALSGHWWNIIKRWFALKQLSLFISWLVQWLMYQVDSLVRRALWTSTICFLGFLCTKFFVWFGLTLHELLLPSLPFYRTYEMSFFFLELLGEPKSCHGLLEWGWCEENLWANVDPIVHKYPKQMQLNRRQSTQLAS